MSLFSKQSYFARQCVTALLIVLLVTSTLPVTALAQTLPDGTDTASSSQETGLGADGETASSTEQGTEGGAGETNQTGQETDVETASSTASTTQETTNDGADGAGASDTQQGQDGNDSGNAASSTDDGTASSTDPTPGDDGTTGGGGDDGQAGHGVEEEDEGEPIPLISENEVGHDETPDDGEGLTGEVVESGSNVGIDTGDARAQGEVNTDVNSNLVRSELLEATRVDLDTFTLNATGTNDAIITTDGFANAQTGDNTALARGIATITTGDAVSAINIANVVNSNVINSDGFLYLKNQVTEPGQELNLSSFFFPDPDETRGLTGDCTLLSCRSEDVVYNFSQFNNATITNDVYIEASSGHNYANGDQLYIETGDARGGANVINVVNTNIIDSNYRLLTYNALGDVDGDLILPTEELFHAFFSRPNGLSIVEDDGVTINIDNDNGAQVNNNLDTFAESGANNTVGVTHGSTIETGMAESESNVLNKINQNVFGGDSMYLLIRVHGYWSGDVKGLPEGLTWAWTPDGILIYNEDAEIAPSTFLPYDVDTYTANILDFNRVLIDNNVNIDAVSGKNRLRGITGGIVTGDAVASANVMNIANTNIIGTNWTYAVINIFGDFDGDVTFSSTDIGVTGSVTGTNNPVTPSSTLNYTYTVKNHGDITATGVTLRQTLQNAYASGTNNQQQVTIGTLTPGQSKQVSLTAKPRTDIASGTFPVIATARIDSNESDGNWENNDHVASITVTNPAIGGSTPGGSTDPSTGSTTASSTNQTPGDEVVAVVTPPSSGGGGGGGGGGNSNKKKIDRDREIEIDPASAPHLVIEKFADVEEDEPVAAGTDVDYTIKITNVGGNAYDATVYDILTNPIGVVISEQSWDLDTILAGEVIELTYTTTYDFKTPSGAYINTATIEAYRNVDSKETGAAPLKINDAEFVVEIVGVPLAVGNVGVLAVFPGANGTVSALLAWETSKKSLSQVFFGQKQPWNTFNESALNYGYANQSFRFSTPKDRHLMIISGLRPGLEYAYRIDAKTAEHETVSREYTVMIPASVTSLALNTGAGFLSTEAILGRVAGVQTTTPVAPAPKPYVPPTPPTPPPPAPEPEPVASDTNAGSGGGFVNAVKDTFFGFFR